MSNLKARLDKLEEALPPRAACDIPRDPEAFVRGFVTRQFRPADIPVTDSHLRELLFHTDMALGTFSERHQQYMREWQALDPGRIAGDVMVDPERSYTVEEWVRMILTVMRNGGYWKQLESGANRTDEVTP